MRKYESIWVKLRDTKVASVVAPPQLHERIKKMVIKEKCADAGCKYLCAEDDIKYRIDIESKDTVLTFKLKRLGHNL